MTPILADDAALRDVEPLDAATNNVRSGQPDMPQTANFGKPTGDVLSWSNDGMDPEPPSLYLGDHPDGMYWSAIRREGAQAGGEVDEDYTVEGPNLRMMWDEGAGPLWSADGLLPDNPEWLRRALNLSDSLVGDLLTWLSDMTALHFGRSVADWREAKRQLDERGRQLAERLQAEVGDRYKVRYQA